MSERPAGWYPDPEARVSARWWDGVWWTAWESDGVQHWIGSHPRPERGPQLSDLAGLSFIRTSFLPEARRQGVLDGPQVDRLAQLTDSLASQVLGPAAAPAVVPDPPGRPVPAPALAPAASTAPSAPAPTDPAPSAAAPTDPAPWVPEPWSPAPPPRPAWIAAPTPPPPVRPGPPPHPGAPVPAPTTPPGHLPGPGGHAFAPVPPRTPSRLARWWSTSRLRLDTDLTVHGLTYLGVLLLFVGVFGLVAFAFGDVDPAMRPVAELAVAAVPFAAALLLARSGAKFVARAMIAVGGLILPVMVVTSTVDGFGFPPDLHGFALPVGTALASAVIAAAFAVRVRLKPDSALGVMVAPVTWFAAGMGAVGLARPVPSGEDVAVPGAAQVAVIALALAITTLSARWTLRRGGATSPVRQALAAGALAAAPAGAVVTAVLGLVSGFAEGWPLAPVLVATTALTLTVRELAPRHTDVVLTAGWLVVVGRVLLVEEATPVLSEHLVVSGLALDARPVLVAAATLAGAGLLELRARRASRPGLALAALGWFVASLTLVAAVLPGGAWWGLGTALALTMWAARRRVHPPTSPGARLALDAITALAPLAAVLGTWHHHGGPAAGLLVASLALAVTPLARGRWAREPQDPFWRGWWASALVLATIGAVALWGDGQLSLPRVVERATVPVMLALVLAAVLAGPGPRGRAVLLATPVTWLACAAVVTAGSGGSSALAIGYAALGLAAVVAAHLGRWARPPASGGSASDVDASAVSGSAHLARGGAARTADGEQGAPALALAIAGIATGALAVPIALDARTLAIVLAAGTVAWLVTAVRGDRERSLVGARLDRAGLASLPWGLVLAGVPGAAVVALHAASLVRVGDPWWALPLSFVALASAAATRLPVPARLGAILPAGAFGLAIVALLASLAERSPLDPREPGVPLGAWSVVAALATVVLVAPIVRERPRVLTWTAWLALAPLVGLTAWTGLEGVRLLGPVVVASGALIGVGGVLAVGALLVDRATPRSPRALPRRPSAVPPFVSGSGHLTLGTASAASLALVALGGGTFAVPEAPGVLLLAAAVLTGAVAALGGVGTVAAVGALLAWVGLRALAPDTYAGAWADVGVSALLLLAALAASRVHRPAKRWARWDVPLSLAAALPALLALVVATVAERPAVLVTVGGLAIGAAVRLARLRATSEVLASLGSVLVLTGAAAASRAWLIAALTGLAVAHTVLAALRESGTWRLARQWVGALLALAAWIVLVSGPGAFGGITQARVDATAVAGSLVAVGVLGLAAAGRLDRSWTAPWGGVGALLTVGAGLVPATVADAGTVTTRALASWWQVAAWALLALGAVLAGQLPGLREEPRASRWRSSWRLAAVVPVLAGLLAGLSAVEASSLARVTVLTLVSLGTAVVLVAATRTGRRGPAPPMIALGLGALVLAAGFAFAGPAVPGISRSVLLAVVLAVAAVEAGAAGVAVRVLGLRLAAPVLAWLAWVVLATESLGGTVIWQTVPVGLTMLAVVAVWRADRRARGLPSSEQGIAALDLAGIAFLVVASLLAALTDAVWHALVAAGIGVLVFFFGALTRVRRRLVAGAVIVLTGVLVAAVLPLVALVPAWGGAALWVAVAVVGLIVVLAATFLERGRAAVQGGRARLRAATQGWE